MGEVAARVILGLKEMKQAMAAMVPLLVVAEVLTEEMLVRQMGESEVLEEVVAVALMVDLVVVVAVVVNL